MKIPPEVANARVRGDELRLSQVLLNLLNNAVKFTPSQGLIAAEASTGGEEVIVRISDSGIGIRPEDQERVFRAFEQVDSSYAREQNGTGIGLALTRRFVELQGGRI